MSGTGLPVPVVAKSGVRSFVSAKPPHTKLLAMCAHPLLGGSFDPRECPGDVHFSITGAAWECGYEYSDFGGDSDPDFGDDDDGIAPTMADA